MTLTTPVSQSGLYVTVVVITFQFYISTYHELAQQHPYEWKVNFQLPNYKSCKGYASECNTL